MSEGIRELEDETGQAVQQAGDNANRQWMIEALATVALLCRRGKDFTTDDVWELLDEMPVHTHERRALGAIIQQFARERAIISTGATRKSIRKNCHRRPLTVWRPVNYRSVRYSDGYAGSRE